MVNSSGRSIYRTKIYFVLPKEVKSKNFRVRIVEAIGAPELKFSIYNI